MNKTIEINTERYERLASNRLFFLRLYENYHYDDKGHEIDYSLWQSIDRELDIHFDAGNFADRSPGYCLCIVDKSEQKKDKDGNVIEGTLIMHFHDISANSVNDWVAVFENYGARAKNAEDKYAYMAMLWTLDKKVCNCATIENAIRRFPSQYFSFFIEAFGKISRCLSASKQEIIETLCRNLGGSYNRYMPPIVTDLHRLICPKSSNVKDKNLYTLVDEIFKAQYNKESIAPLVTGNPLAAVFKWFHDEEALYDYSVLRPVFAMLRDELRLDVVKRYFHDIRLGNTALDLNIVNQFKDNDYDDFIRYRYCIETPAEPIVLTVPLLCDNIITLYNTKGTAFQTFDGVLDFAMTHCDLSQPAIQFKMERFIPTCDGGAIYNNSFKGFIDYATIRIIDESKLTEDELMKTIRIILDSYGRRKQYCSDNENEDLPDNQIGKCRKIGCMSLRTCEDKWLVPGKYADVLNSFIKHPIGMSQTELEVNSGMLATDTFKDYILGLPKGFIQVDDKEFIVPSYSRRKQTYNLFLIEKYSIILRLRIFPQEGAIVGQKFDVFGFWRKIAETHNKGFYQMSEDERKNAMKDFCALESQEVKSRTITSLKEELQSEAIDGTFFEIPFDRNILAKVIHKFYHQGTITENDQIYEKEFLTTLSMGGKFKPFCAPELSKKHNPAIDLPYFWCRGKECFHNNLQFQTIAKQNNWHDYSLYHLVEIIGYPKLHETEAGYEPDSVVWQFIAITNKVAQKFKRLKCRSCGHMLFSSYRVTGFNRINYYGCLNPTCQDRGKLVYLNFCFHCKKGLIDSRDSKQCPNGWYICPSCLSCCDDAQYERQAQRYVLSGRPVPEGVESKRGQGHNDKDIYFCPQCGSQIEIIKDENGSFYKGCRNCKRNFDKEAEEQDLYGYN